MLLGRPPRSAIKPASADQDFVRDCVEGLSLTQKAIPCKWLYDAAGSSLFEQICVQPEYYPARVEFALLEQAAPAVLAELEPGATLIELGSGASRKTRILLSGSTAISTYVPIDISADELARSAAAIRNEYFGLRTEPLCSDFGRPADLKLDRFDRPLLCFFPGSTIGNMRPPRMVRFLADLRVALGTGSRLLLGVDLLKEPEALIAAYDDAAGVTAAFNLNLLTRINREIGGAIDPTGFVHRAIWNPNEHRIEMHLEATRPQLLRIGDFGCTMAAGETIHTEDTHKLPRGDVEEVLTAAGWRVRSEWTGDPAFLVCLLEPLPA